MVLYLVGFVGDTASRRHLCQQQQEEAVYAFQRHLNDSRLHAVEHW